jgi:uncharacterized protein (DUF342 family)
MTEQILEFSGDGFRLNVSDDSLRVLLTCSRDALMRPSLQEEIQKGLTELCIALPFQAGIFQEAQKTALASGTEIHQLPVVTGDAPVLPVDGVLEWTDEYFTPGYFIDPITKRIDFHQKAERPAVTKDQLLVKVFKPVPGKDGVDVFGKAIKAPRPREAELRAGVNVAWDESLQGYRALCSGKVKWVGRTLDVYTVLRISGDVGNETGNIKHNGLVTVGGNVESEFIIEAAGDIEVKGIVYAADITCGGNLIVAEGINENPLKKIQVRGETAAKYIINAVLDSLGSINVKKEIFQSRLRSAGEVNCSEGRIVGGEIIAARGGTAWEVGSRGNVATSIIAGVNYDILDRLRSTADDVMKLKEKIKKLTPVYKKLKACLSGLNAAQKESLMEMEYYISEAETEIAALEEMAKSLRRDMYAGRDARITILNMVYPGVILRVLDAQMAVEQPLLGPLAAYQDKITGALILTSEVVTKS